MAQNNFAGVNSRSLAQFLTNANSDIEFVRNPQNGHIFAILSSTGVAITVSANAQQDINANGLGTLADYQVCDMPAKDQQTGAPIPGKFFTLITKRASNNIIGTLCR